MGISGAPDIFQQKMTTLMANLEFIRVYLDDLLILTKSSFSNHLTKLETVFERLRKANLKVNIAKSGFALSEIEYLGYILTREGIRPQNKKVAAILKIGSPTNVKSLRMFIGMVQYYRDAWEKRSELLAPLTDLVGECGHTKVTRKNGTKKKPWYWSQKHEDAFQGIKNIIAREVMLAYPDFNILFEI